ncbi:hypothetical protein FOA43_002532 [Brettanomyces nanus]|uniref:Uncharacterized protein n=1 Tax=Eeniella nana TaxID=13502 RepID=A0A875S2P3_EENNA|nr:uncharacterized protein FOA43_002532 [Brettanomyces nanus]QPG75183.1 hypothetical protein FOA43_002532 [Brettanomyces nanus]
MAVRESLDKYSDTMLLAREHPEIAPDEIIAHKRTGMKSRLKFSDNSHREKVWSQEMLYHYVNMIIDRFGDNGDSSLGLFRNQKSYGPKGGLARVVFHPFKWGGDWHLAIGFAEQRKMLFLNCGGENFAYRKGVGSFSMKAALVLEDFIVYFGKKISKYALKYPRVYSHIFEPSSPLNAINLLSAVFAFCVDEKAITNTFCNADATPRKYDVSDFYPVLKSMDRYAYTRSVLGNRFVDTMIQKTHNEHDEDEEAESLTAMVTSVTVPSHPLPPPPPLKDDLASFFSVHAAKQFLHYLVSVDDFYKVPEFLDELVEMLENLSHDKRTNPELTETEEHYWEWNLLARENLYAEYTKKTKMEFNENELGATLKAADHRNQVYPLIFENGIVYLVNINTDENKFDAHVKVAVISNRNSTNERAVLKNYALRRLVEMYTWQYRRLIKDVKVSLHVLKEHSPYNVLICTLYCLHYFVFHRKFVSRVKPSLATLDNYGICLQQLMHDIVDGNTPRRNADYKAMIKYLR